MRSGGSVTYIYVQYIGLTQDVVWSLRSCHCYGADQPLVPTRGCHMYSSQLTQHLIFMDQLNRPVASGEDSVKVKYTRPLQSSLAGNAMFRKGYTNPTSLHCRAHHPLVFFYKRLSYQFDIGKKNGKTECRIVRRGNSDFKPSLIKPGCFKEIDR
jgi:hypothetical protein